MTPRRSSPEGMVAKSVVTTTRAGKMLSMAEYAAALAMENALWPKAAQTAFRRCLSARSMEPSLPALEAAQRKSPMLRVVSCCCYFIFH